MTELPTAGLPASSVVLITGIMAAGKSTVAQALAERLPRAVHIRGDGFRRMIVSGRVEMGDEDEREALAQLRLRHRLSAQAADTCAQAGWTAVVQDIVIGPDLAAYAAMVRTRPFHVVVLAPSPATVQAREAARPKTGYGPGGWTPEVMDRILREGTPRTGLWLETTGQSPAETVDTVLSRLGEARVAG
ncbi:AAA family ATPase [Streptomyces sp. CAU 1734]|uniref:AAA family ATPase n=1 Tax=Streptomyces sp. CAU 1734 TaxID=3140360 RepID=UPI00326135AC